MFWIVAAVLLLWLLGPLMFVEDPTEEDRILHLNTTREEVCTEIRRNHKGELIKVHVPLSYENEVKRARVRAYHWANKD